MKIEKLIIFYFKQQILKLLKPCSFKLFIQIYHLNYLKLLYMQCKKKSFYEIYPEIF